MKPTIISILVTIVLIGGALVATRDNSPYEIDKSLPENNVNVIDGKQIIEIRAKGGFLPRKSIAKANVPTILRFNTQGTFDCSSIVAIPSLGINRTLPPMGTTDIDLGLQKIGILQGMCGMGMYPFEIEFQN